MKALVVYESLFGNTASIAGAVAAGLRVHGIEAEASPVTEVPAADTAGIDLLIVGGPTHAHGMSRASTRKAGANDKRNTFAEPTVSPGLREWLGDLPDGARRPAAAFDTRFDKSPLLTGSAAKGIARRLEQQGFTLVTAPESFFVTDENRLEDGQTDHATAWGAALADRVTQAIMR
jgi:hypothetical protein